MNEINTHELQWKAMLIKGFVGKNLLEHENGSFKIVKIQPGATFPLHQHPEKTEFAYVLKGTLEATIGDQVYTGGSGMFYRFPTGIQHGLRNPGQVETVVLIGAIKDA